MAVQVDKLKEVFRDQQNSDLHGETLYFNPKHEIIGVMFFALNVKSNTPTAKLLSHGTEDVDVWRPYNANMMTPPLMQALIEANIVDLFYLYSISINQEVRERTYTSTCFDHPRTIGGATIVRRKGMLKTIIAMSKLSHWLGQSVSFTQNDRYVFTNFPVKT